MGVAGAAAAHLSPPPPPGTAPQPSAPQPLSPSALSAVLTVLVRTNPFGHPVSVVILHVLVGRIALADTGATRRVGTTATSAAIAILHCKPERDICAVD